MIDPRTLVPLDLAAIGVGPEDVQARRRARGGGAGRLRSRDRGAVQSAAFDFLDAPVVRIGAPFAPVPLSAPLEDAYLPGAADVVAAVRALVTPP